MQKNVEGHHPAVLWFHRRVIPVLFGAVFVAFMYIAVLYIMRLLD